MSQNNSPAKKIIHIDMDCFYAAIEMRENPDLKNIPLAVGYEGKRSVICTANYEARKYGVRSALSSLKAKKLCPHLTFVPVRMSLYKEESQKIFSLFKNFTDKIQPLSLDEAFLDVSECKDFNGSATLIAQEIRKQIFTQTDLTASAGIAPNKFLAKVASDWNKPNGQFVVAPKHVEEFVKKLPIEKIWGVGKVTAQKMHSLGLYTCNDIQKWHLPKLHSYFGKFGKTLYELSRGIDKRSVENTRTRKSLSVERTFENDITHAECHTQLQKIYPQFLQRLEKFLHNKTDYKIKSCFIKLKFLNFQTTTIERTGYSLDYKNFENLMQEGLLRKNLQVRLLGLGVRFFDKEKESYEQLDLI